MTGMTRTKYTFASPRDTARAIVTTPAPMEAGPSQRIRRTPYTIPRTR